jgi:hypothetical protein
MPRRGIDQYQITSIGGPAPNLHVAQQINGGKFKIAGGASNRRVSWQITGAPRGKPAAEKGSEQINAKQMQKHRDQMTTYAKLVESNRRRVSRAR